mmetsp:Transcript_6221/g.18769  ORF Transcript_6221/g.18769 Transcript_6221/m.18769 type:complete len:203 (+) Transcript_6221:222-830(+)
MEPPDRISRAEVRKPTAAQRLSYASLFDMVSHQDEVRLHGGEPVQAVDNLAVPARRHPAACIQRMGQRSGQLSVRSRGKQLHQPRRQGGWSLHCDDVAGIGPCRMCNCRVRQRRCEDGCCCMPLWLRPRLHGKLHQQPVRSSPVLRQQSARRQLGQHSSSLLRVHASVGMLMSLPQSLQILLAAAQATTQHSCPGRQWQTRT